MQANNTSKIYTIIKQKLTSVRNKQLSVNAITGFFILSITLIAILYFFSFLNSILHLSTTFRTIIFYSFLVIQTLVAIYFIGIPLLTRLRILKGESDYRIATKVGNQFPQIKDRLLNAIQIYEQKEIEQQKSLSPIYSYSLIDAAFEGLYNEIKDLNFIDAVDFKQYKFFRKNLLLTILGAIIFYVLFPNSLNNSLYQLLNYWKEFTPPPKILFSIQPGNYEAVKDETVTLTVQTSGNRLESIKLFTRQEGVIKFEPILLKPIETIHTENSYNHIFRHTIHNIKNSTIYYAEALDIKSDEYKIEVLDRPIIKSLQLTLNYPPYTKLTPRKLETNVGDATVITGTVVDFFVQSSKKLSFAEIIFEDNSKLKLTTDKVNAYGKLKLLKERDYQISIVDEDSLKNAAPITYKLKVIPDENPSVEILIPGKNIDVSENLLVNLLIRIKDDYGFSKLQLAHRLVHSRYEMPQEEFTYIEIPLQNKLGQLQEIWYDWNLAGLRLVPEDVLAYYVEIFDNDVISGPKSSRSTTYLVRLPSLEEVFADVDQTQKQTIETLQSAVKDAQQLKKQLDELQREMKKSQKVDWQQQKKAEELTKKYENLKKNISEAAKKLDEMIQKMDENRLLSQQTLEKYLELQKLMEELRNPELQEALKKLQERMQQLTPEQMKQAMQQLSFSEEEFKKNLERTLELLKRIHIEQKVDELIRRTEELIKQQQQIQQEVSKTNPADKEKLENLMKQQENLMEQISRLQEETKNLKEKMSEFPEDMPIEKMENAEKNLSDKKLQQKSMKSSMQMKSGQMREASQTQSEMVEDLQDFLSQMQDVQKSMQEQMQREVLNKMRKVVQDLLELSQQQENLKQEVRNLEPNSQRFRESTQQQFGLMENLNNIANSMAEISKKSFAISPEMGKEIGNAMREMSQALQNMEQRNPFGTSQKQTEAMASMNRAAMLMQNTISAMKKGGSKGMGMASLMQRLGQMAGIQAGINAQTAQAMGQGQGLTPQQMAEYARIAGQQAALQKSLEQLAKEAKEMGEYSKLLGDLDRIAKDMIEVETDLEQGNINPETLRKQERILSRLLDSQRSMRERDYEKRRRAEVARDYRRTTPADIDLTNQENKNRIREELLKTLEEKYSKDYEELIKRYFEELDKIHNQFNE